MCHEITTLKHFGAEVD